MDKPMYNVTPNNEIGEIEKKVENINVYVGEDKKLHFVDSTGADSVLPFKSDFELLNPTTKSESISVSGLTIGKKYLLVLADIGGAPVNIKSITGCITIATVGTGYSSTRSTEKARAATFIIEATSQTISWNKTNGYSQGVGIAEIG